jgi:excisionase family DNA binding protein
LETRLLKSEEVARILQVSKAYAYVLMNRGEIPLVRIGKIVLVRLEDLERYIKEKAEQNDAQFSLRVGRFQS